jgi:hypothetical protein
MKNLFKYTALSLALFFASCDSLLKVDPRQSIDASTALTSEAALEAAIFSSYDRLQAVAYYGSNFIVSSEALSGNVQGANNGNATRSGRQNGQVNNNPGAHLIIWNTCYLLLNQVNLILEAAPSVTPLTTAKRNQIEGEALFLRALAHFDLLRTYSYDEGAVVPANDRGGVPVITTGVLNPSQLTFPRRAPREEVYDQIYADLTLAIEKLAGVPNSRAPFFITATAAKALFARVALYRKDFANAVLYATEAIQGGVGTLQGATQIVGAWSVPQHPESIFELQFLTPENIGVNESLQTYYTSTIQGSTATGGFGDLVVPPAVLALFGGGDARNGLFRKGSIGRGNAGLDENIKFYGKNGQPNLDNVPLIRIPEMYFTRAEANFFLGNEAAARTDLATMRAARFVTPPPTAETGDALLNAIWLERRKELAFEGHYWFDLKRTGRDITGKTWATTLAPAGGVMPFTDFRFLAPIPQQDIDANPNLEQNVGY